MNYDPNRDTSWQAVFRRTISDWKWLILTPFVALFALVAFLYAGVLIHLHIMTLPTFAKVNVNYAKNPTRYYLFALLVYTTLTIVGVRTMRKWKHDS